MKSDYLIKVIKAKYAEIFRNKKMSYKRLLELRIEYKNELAEALGRQRFKERYNYDLYLSRRHNRKLRLERPKQGKSELENDNPFLAMLNKGA